MQVSTYEACMLVASVWSQLSIYLIQLVEVSSQFLPLTVLSNVSLLSTKRI